VKIPNTKYSKRFRAFLCTPCRKRRAWHHLIDLSEAREWRREYRELKRLKKLNLEKEMESDHAE